MATYETGGRRVYTWGEFLVTNILFDSNVELADISGLASCSKLSNFILLVANK